MRREATIKKEDKKMKCPKCNNDTPSGSGKCVWCGAELGSAMSNSYSNSYSNTSTNSSRISFGKGMNNNFGGVSKDERMNSHTGLDTNANINYVHQTSNPRQPSSQNSQPLSPMTVQPQRQDYGMSQSVTRQPQNNMMQHPGMASYNTSTNNKKTKTGLTVALAAVGLLIVVGAAIFITTKTSSSNEEATTIYVSDNSYDEYESEDIQDYEYSVTETDFIGSKEMTEITETTESEIYSTTEVVEDIDEGALDDSFDEDFYEKFYDVEYIGSENGSDSEIDTYYYDTFGDTGAKSANEAFNRLIIAAENEDLDEICRLSFKYNYAGADNSPIDAQLTDIALVDRAMLGWTSASENEVKNMNDKFCKKGYLGGRLGLTAIETVSYPLDGFTLYIKAYQINNTAWFVNARYFDD